MNSAIKESPETKNPKKGMFEWAISTLITPFNLFFTTFQEQAGFKKNTKESNSNSKTNSQNP